MSYSEITRGGKSIRPEFDFSENENGKPYDTDVAAAHLLQSIRNVNEGYLRALLHEIQILRIEAEQQTAILRRIDRRLATKVKIRGHK